MKMNWILRYVWLLLPVGIVVGCSTGKSDEAAAVGESVVLLHGMGRTGGSMAILALRFEDAGYEAHVFSYRQATASLDDLSESLQRFIDERVQTPTYHLVAHSLGNIIIRNGFRGEYRPGLGRIVMLAPPNQPAELAQVLADNPLYQWMTGDSGQKLADSEFYANLPVPPVEFGIIAGDKGQQISFDEPNDGVVKVETTKLPGAADWVVVHRTHTFIMTAEDTFEYCRRFIETGKFGKDSGT